MRAHLSRDTEALDHEVRRFVYDVTLQRGKPPLLAEIVEGLRSPRAEITGSLQRLAAARMLVLQPGSGEILMANPFSAVPTPFVVKLDRYSCFGNCIWDAMGIAAMTHSDARIESSCGDCAAGMEVIIENGSVRGDEGIVHFGVPAHHWWDDIVFN